MNFTKGRKIEGIKCPQNITRVEFGYTTTSFLGLPDCLCIVIRNKHYIVDEKLIDKKYDNLKKYNPRVYIKNGSSVSKNGYYLVYSNKTIKTFEEALDCASLVVKKLDEDVEKVIRDKDIDAIKFIIDLGSIVHIKKVLPEIWKDEKLKKELLHIAKDYENWPTDSGQKAIWYLVDELDRNIISIDLI